MSPIILPEPEQVTLRDHAQLTIRPIRPDDAPRLQALHSRLTPESIYLRFLDMHPFLQADEAQRFASLDYRTRMAFVATEKTDTGEQIIGVARYAVEGPLHPTDAEYAIVIEDRYQGRGLGRLLMQRLISHARANGIEFFTAEVSVENEGMIHLLQRLNLPVEKHLDAGVGVWGIRIALKVEKRSPARRPAKHRKTSVRAKSLPTKNLAPAGRVGRSKYK
jgi:ribosomal protein S18 acetylase RimI-like enzyme